MASGVNFQDLLWLICSHWWIKTQLGRRFLKGSYFRTHFWKGRGFLFPRWNYAFVNTAVASTAFSWGSLVLTILHQKALLFEAGLAVGSHASGSSRDASDPSASALTCLFWSSSPLTDSRGTACVSLGAFCHKAPGPCLPLFITCFMNVAFCSRPDFRDMKNTLNMGCHSNRH